MKNKLFWFYLIFGLILPTAFLLSLSLSDYSQTLNNGVRVKMEHGWNYIQLGEMTTQNTVFQSNQSTLVFLIQPRGDLISGQAEIALMSGNKIVDKIANGSQSNPINKGKYSALVKIPLQNTNGYIQFKIKDIDLKENQRAEIPVLLNDIQISVDEADEDFSGFAIYDLSCFWAKQKIEIEGYSATLNVFTAKTHERMIIPEEVISDQKARIRPGTYDFYLDVQLNHTQNRYTCWLENFKVQPNKSYHIVMNLNAAIALYQVGKKTADKIYYFPKGSAQKYGLKIGKKVLAASSYTIDGSGKATVCPEGEFDLLISYNYGESYEWKEGLNFKYGERTLIP